MTLSQDRFDSHGQKPVSRKDEIAVGVSSLWLSDGRFSISKQVPEQVMEQVTEKRSEQFSEQIPGQVLESLTKSA